MELKRNSVIALHLDGKSQADIVRKLSHLKLNKFFVHRTIKRYKESGSIAKRYGGGRQRTATSPEMIRMVEERIQENPTLSGNKLAKELGISLERIQHILKNCLGLKSYKIRKDHQHKTSDDLIKMQASNVEKEDTLEIVSVSTIAKAQTTYEKHNIIENESNKHLENVIL